MRLVIGDKAWSSWSMRPWLALKRAGLPFEERLVRLRRDDTREAARAAGSPSGMVPVLITDDGEAVWDSLAICEWAAERAGPGVLWPADPSLRALARAAAAEMHAGFPAVRAEFSMDLRAPPTPKAPSPAAEGELRRLAALWGGLLARSGGPFLGGGWSIADAAFTPVATRLRTYALDLRTFCDDGAASAYAELLLQEPEFLEWEAAA